MKPYNKPYLHRSIVNPAKASFRFFLVHLFLLVHGSLGQFAITIGQLANIFTFLLGLAGESFNVLQIPSLDQVLDNVRVINGRVDPDALGDLRKVAVEVGIFSVRHLFGGHDDLSTHHVSKGHDQAVGVSLDDFFAKGLVGLLVTTFVSGNLGADFAQSRVAVLSREASYIGVRDLGGPFLERSVHESSVGVLSGIRVEPVGDQVLNGDFDAAHVAFSTEVQIFVQEISVSVFFGRPSAAPSSPSRVGVSRGIIAAFKSVEERLVGGKGFLRDHVTDKNNHEIIGNSFHHLSHFLDFVFPSFLGKIGEEVLWLPGFFPSLQKNFIDHGTSNGSDVLNDFDVFGIQKAGRLETFLKTVRAKLGTANILIFFLGNHGGVNCYETSRRCCLGIVAQSSSSSSRHW
mmetsp:Transcript_24916/g.44135  ORF Transcript_24916/g.44135 Transcript_24916/m.44135 type:complete len:402 (+) Transcript_24916:254-1459(+)